MSEDPEKWAQHSPAFREMLRGANRPARGEIDRIAIRRTDDGLGIHNPTRRSFTLIVGLSLWLLMWSAGLAFALGEIFGSVPLPAKIFLLIWLAIWLVGGLVTVAVVAWQLAGIERIFVIAGVLATETGVGPFQIRRYYPLSTVSKIRDAATGSEEDLRSTLFGTVAFDVDKRTKYLGVGLDASERDAVIKALQAEMDVLAKDRG